MKWHKLLLFAGGALFGSAGVSILSSRDAKKAYTHCTAAVLRGKDCVMKTAATVKENCGDIYADAVEINERRYQEAEEREIADAKAVLEAHAKTEDEAEAAE